MQYDFNKVINRRGTYSTQWDYIQDRFGRSDILPFSISDTDFPVPIGVKRRLNSVLNILFMVIHAGIMRITK